MSNVIFCVDFLGALGLFFAKNGEKLACVVDIGGGTSDFTIIKIGRELINKPDRQDDILASTGVRIGGNDFDKDLALKSFMP